MTSMPRPGGEADKLGNRYEGIWIVNALLDLITGDLTSIVVEPIGHEATGCEFVSVRLDGVREAHSVKRQTSRGSWSLSALVRPQPSGRSILGDLVSQTLADRSAVFVSGVAAQELRELSSAARSCDSIVDFEEMLADRGKLSAEFVKRVVPLTADDREAAFQALQRIYVRTVGESELIDLVELRIRSALRTNSGGQLDLQITRLLLGEIVVKHLGQQLTAQRILDELARHGISPARYTGAADVRERLDLLTSSYLRDIRRTLINGTEIERPEAFAAFEGLSTGRSVLVDASAGLGKSCVVVQTIEELQRSGVPCLVLRADTLQAHDTSARGWGQARGLPDSPVVTLANFAGDARSVLCIDQLDAVSVVSARNPTAWALVEEILYEVSQFPNVRLLIACRSFELCHDPRLQSLADDREAFEHVTVDALPHDTVRATIMDAGLDATELTERQIDLLATPLHLFLFLQAKGPRKSFTSRGELFDQYWATKERDVEVRSGRSGGWVDGVGALCDALSAAQTLEVPAHVLDTLNDVRTALQSEAVVLADEGRLRFFHESFFDYAFARTFLRQRGDLVEWLTSDEQQLFRRSQVRQVLEFLRDREADRGRYLQVLEGLLRDDRIRFHIRKVVLDWVRRVPEPSADEWLALERAAPDLSDHVWNVIRNSAKWFDVLHDLGKWSVWLTSEDDAMINRALFLLCMPDLLAQRSKEVADLLRPFRGRSPEWDERISWIMRRGDIYQSPEMQQFFLHLLADGVLDDLRPGFAMNDDWWSVLYQASTAAPDFTAQVLGAWWDRQVARAHEADRADPFHGDPELVPYSQFSSRIIRESATRASETFASEMFPRLARLDHAAPQLIYPVSFDSGHPADEIRAGVIQALTEMARAHPERLDAILADHREAPREWTASVLLIAWSANPERYADETVAFILENPTERLAIGYAWAMGEVDMLAAVSRTAIAAAGAQCGDAAFGALEGAILGFSPEWEGRIRAIGRTALALLRALPVDRLSEQARRRLQELERRFPDAPERGAPRPASGHDRMLSPVGPPIPDASQPLMTDDQWLAAMDEYADDESEFRDGRFVGGAIELSRGLEALVGADPERFAALVDRMHRAINPVYFGAILSGLAPLVDGHRRASRPDLVWQVIRRIADLGVHVPGTEIARAVRGTTNADVPDDIVEHVCRIAVADSDPERDTWHEQGRGDPLHQAINSARGTAAETISGLLFADRTRWIELRPTVERLVADPVLAVRTTAVYCLLAVLDTERRDALDLFAQLADGADAILDNRTINEFMHHAIFREYSAMRAILLRMLASDRPSCVRSGARLMTMAALWTDGEEESLALVLERDEHARAGAAEVFAGNLPHADVGVRCDAYLRTLFHDESAQVRKAASDCWRLLAPDEVAARGSLVEAFADSPAFADGEHMLTFHLRQAQRPLPPEVCRVAERAVEVFGTRAASIQYREAGDAGDIGDLMLRLHAETSDPQIRRRVLNAIDMMMHAGFFGLDEKVDERFSR